ncbi:Uncharacterised protein [Mycobacterium tuberculosis]|nr:Uncharacterised protein [Mycobacterium tuberculosis]
MLPPPRLELPLFPLPMLPLPVLPPPRLALPWLPMPRLGRVLRNCCRPAGNGNCAAACEAPA